MVGRRRTGEEEMGWGSFLEKGQDSSAGEEEEGGAGGGQEEKGKSRTSSCPMEEFCNGELRVRRGNVAWRGRSFPWEATESVAVREDF